jgi:hypothetical protein
MDNKLSVIETEVGKGAEQTKSVADQHIIDSIAGDLDDGNGNAAVRKLRSLAKGGFKATSTKVMEPPILQ